MVHRRRTSDEEEEYFKREDAAKLAKMRRDRQLEALRGAERSLISDALDTDEGLAQEVLSLGFDAETARVLPLIPLIQVAWADGRISRAEDKTVWEKANAFGVEKDSAAGEFLSMLLQERPSGIFFERVNLVIREIVADAPESDIATNVLGWSKAVAEASGGFFGLVDPIDVTEQRVLDDLAAHFGITGG